MMSCKQRFGAEGAKGIIDASVRRLFRQASLPESAAQMNA
jgi:hypothetical protein